ncbi:TlpA disulfide reductase family protein [Aestuariibaculum lutulentum]|uniref:TlpA family protein disulfide reductase n=1 Tax=Aestuariibaculum lutulentum TaxID=2920935 RepID=A0ABS9REH1_9FLAO|nr:TlpA disulfide reductase family protein [Aestuariibaculum lutulentum]MCH4551333.1 TlpA family protein disulfide reductase [Aestuariibaculum lutulentum]
MRNIHLVLGLTTIISLGCSSSKKVGEITQEQLNQMNLKEAEINIKHLLKSEDEKDFEKVVKYYNFKKDTKKYYEVKNKAIEKFPQGYYAFSQSSGAFVLETDLELKKKGLEELKANFPAHNFDVVYFAFIKFFLDKDMCKEALEYQQEMIKTSRTRYYLLISILNKSEGKIDKINYLKSDISAFSEILRSTKKNQKNEDSLLRMLKFQLAKAYYEVGDNKHSIEVIQELRREESTVKGLSLQYAILLAKCGSYNEVLPVLENAIIEGKSTDEIKHYLEQAYKATGKTDFNLYFKGLINQMNSNILSHVNDIRINEPAPDFILKDKNGNDVTNKDLKGKTLIIDFWATWCGPCKQSFPGMQAAVNKYKNDDSVKFLFVHTFEKDHNPLTLAKNYLSENQYDFELFMDCKNKETKKNQAANAFGITGIPTKVVIDPNGNIRFKVVGFKRNIDSMVAELSAMINLSQSEFVE